MHARLQHVPKSERREMSKELKRSFWMGVLREEEQMIGHEVGELGRGQIKQYCSHD
jgi:hypothetical protein